MRAGTVQAGVARPRLRRVRGLPWVDTPWGLRILSLAVVLAVWEWYGRLPYQVIVPPPSQVLGTLGRLTVSGELPLLLLGSARHLAIGFLLAVGVGLPVGVLIGFWRPAEAALEPLVDAMFVMSKEALIPVIVLWFGIFLAGKAVVVFLFSVFVVIVNVVAGARHVSPELIETARSFCARGLALQTNVVIPSMAPYIVAGLRQGLARAVRGMVVADLFLLNSDLGGFLVDAGAIFDMPALMAGTLFVMLVGLLLVSLTRPALVGFGWMERHDMPLQAGFRQGR